MMSRWDVVSTGLRYGITKQIDDRTGVTRDDLRDVIHEFAHAASLGILRPAGSRRTGLAKEISDSIERMGEARRDWEELRALAVEIVVLRRLRMYYVLRETGDDIRRAAWDLERVARCVRHQIDVRAEVEKAFQQVLVLTTAKTTQRRAARVLKALGAAA